jgi:hypothetical protein
MITRVLSRILAVALLLAQPVHSHFVDPLELLPLAPAPGAQLETFSGVVRELVVVDRVADLTARYYSLAADDGSHLALSAATQGLEHGRRVEVTGRRNGNTLFVNDVRTDGRSRPKTTVAVETSEVEGTLRMYHVDYLEEGHSHFGYDVVDANDEATPIRFGVQVGAIHRGMRVIVRGSQAHDGAIEPRVVTILALPDDAANKVTQKAARTDNVLVILMRFSDSPTNPFTREQVQAAWTGGPGTGSVAEYFKEVSFNQQLLNVTVTPWLSIDSATPSSCNWSQMGTLGRSAAASAGYTTSGYHKIVYVFPRVSSCGWAGLAYVGGSGAWINGRNTTLVYGHELGHNFGMLHAARLDCGTAVIGGTCSVAEYGDPFGIMGNSSAMHVNAFQKSDMGWIPAATVRTHAAGSAIYTLSPLETAGGSTYAVKVPAAANRTYWLEYRRPLGFDAGLASYPNNGALIRVAAPFETMCSGCDSYSNDTQLIDTTPATSTFTDAALLAGRSFTDTKYGITFNVLTASATALTVQVVGPGGAVSTTTLASGSNPALSGVSVSFTATVSGTSPTGNVTFRANGTTIAGCSAVSLSGTGNSRTAVCATASLAVGTHGVVAQYNGDGSNPASTSATLSQVVNSAPPTGTNVALAINGATATASSVYGASYPASSLINNERAGINFQSGGGWKDGTPSAWPDWVEVRFNGSKRIDRVVVYSVQDAWRSPVEPTSTLTGSDYPLTNFTVQGWNGTSWVTLGTVSGNSLIKRTVTFAAFITDRIRVSIASAADGYSRMTELEAWGEAVVATQTNVALASNGATATVSSMFGSAYVASSVINDERTGNGFQSGGGWKDGTPGAWPDWAEVRFNGSKRIDRVVVYSVQDAWRSPVEPTATMTGSDYPLTNFSVQGWNGTGWVTLATVSGNSLIKRTVTFAAFTTDRIRVTVTSTPDGYSRLTELEAWGY